jgi:cupin 2 domain-containing protein
VTADSGAERIEVLLRTGGVRIERIVSRGHRSPEGFWYNQDEGEWVTVVEGRARLRLADPDGVVELGPGDWIDLPAHRRHRVEWTDPERDTVWLAVFYTAGD